MAQYKLGRLAPIPNRPAIMLSRLLTGQVPEHPANVDHLDIGGWQMLGNDRYGDCVAVTAANVRRLMSKQYPSMGDVVAFYKTQNPGFPRDDNGMVIQTALEELVKNGRHYFDRVAPIAFAKVDLHNLDEVKAAISIFGYVWVGINVQRANMDQFDAGQPWDYVAGSPVEGGHSIVVGAYDSDGTGADLKCVTWAQETGWTDAFWTHQAEEAWVVVWPEHLHDDAFQVGVDVSELAAAYSEITGRALPTPPPAPTPVPPTPAPTPTPPADEADQKLLAVAPEWLTHRHGGRNKDLADVLAVWVKAKQG